MVIKFPSYYIIIYIKFSFKDRKGEFMKEIKVSVLDRNKLQLQEDGQKGDIILLDEIADVDLTYISDLVNKAKEQEINKRIEEAINKERKKIEENAELKYKNKENELNLTFKDEKQNIIDKYENDLNTKINEVKDLQNKLERLEESLSDKLKLEANEIEKKYLENINTLKQDKQNLQKDLENQKEKNQQEIQIAVEKAKSEQLNKFIEEKDELIKQINNLKLAKTSLNIKQIGENLESWCNNTVLGYMQNGFTNCEWYKDNILVKNEGENKASKADFIFKIYATDEKKENELLTSICLDMKDEDPESKNKKSNKDYYDALNNNRNKKHCKYAVLVSNLEADKPNDIPIFKVNDYMDMYVVRPAYLMTFLNMITSLTKGFMNMVMEVNKEKAYRYNMNEFVEQFDKLKDTYLDKPLATLQNSINELVKKNNQIKEASDNIQEIIDKINKNYLDAIQDKLDKFKDKVLKAGKKVEG